MNLPQTENIDCPLCHGQEYKINYKLGFWKIVQCNNCNFIYVNPRLQRTELQKIYHSNYFDNTVIGYYHYTENKELRKKNFTKWVTDALPFSKKASSLRALDIGCAMGYCLEVFQELGWKGEGIELDIDLSAELNRKGYRVFCTTLLDTVFNQSYSTITLFDVVEHLADPKENFRKLHSILDDDGMVIIVTPDYNSLQRKLFGKNWFQFKPIEHINYFTVQTLTQLASETGFHVVKSKKSGQFCNAAFLRNRLVKYKLGLLSPFVSFALNLFNKGRKEVYVDTASLYVVLKKNTGK